LKNGLDEVLHGFSWVHLRAGRDQVAETAKLTPPSSTTLQPMTDLHLISSR